MDRRQFLRWSAMSSLALLGLPNIGFATANTQKRFIFIIQRGAADGLNTVVPYADPDYKRLRGSLAIQNSIKLDSFFGLHPALKQTAELYQSGQALFLHSVASPYRERSHFDAQNVLETGSTVAYESKEGWMNRLLGLLPASQNEAIALAASIPMALRGKHDVNAYAPSNLREAPDDLLMRVGQLYAYDAQLNALWLSAMSANNLAEDASAKQDPANIGKLTANFLTQADGPRIAMIETGGWDTHSAQEARLNRQLTALDTLIGALKTHLGEHWQQTTVLVATEFGRTAAANGTGGTDHGTASAAMLLGGDLKGGRVIADWPGLSASQLYQGRDLKPTLNLNNLIASVLGERFHLDTAKVAHQLFANSTSGSLMQGFIKT